MEDGPNSTGSLIHDTPILSKTTIDNVPVYTVENEAGFFPTRDVDGMLTSHLNCKLYQIHPKYAHVQDHSSKSTIAEGIFTLSDPAPGVPSEVVLIGECDGMMFYIKNDDAVVKISSRIFTVFLPEDCIAISIPEEADEDTVLYMEGIFAARTKFNDKSDQIQGSNSSLSSDIDVDSVLNDPVSKSMYNFSLFMANKIESVSETGAKYISQYGEKKRSNVTQIKDFKVGPTSMYAADAFHKAGKFTNKTVKTIGKTVSNTIGGALAGKLGPHSNDGKMKRFNKKFLISSALVFSNIAGGTARGYLLVLRATKDEAVDFVSTKYGHDASELVRKTLGASIHFGEAALSARRLLNVKKILKDSAKVALNESLKK